MPREISAGAVVFRITKENHEFLLLLHGLGHWDFPKGNIEQGEDEKETVRREITEETGITRLTFIEGFRETIRYFYKWKGKGIFKIVIFYLVKTRQKKIRLSYEHRDCAWLPFAEALNRLSFHNSKQVLKTAMQVLRRKA